MGIDLALAAFLSTFRLEYMRLTGSTFIEASKAAFDWIGANADWRNVHPAQAAALSLAPRAHLFVSKE